MTAPWFLSVLLLGAAGAGSGCSSSGANKGGAGGMAGWGGAGGDGPGGAGGGGAVGIDPAAPPDIVIVLDRSASMNDGIDGTSCTGGCGAASKWTLLSQELGRALSSADTSVAWGLKLFASNKTCDVAPGVDVAPRLGNATTIAATLALVSATTSTPTTAAVNTTAAYLTTLADGAPKYMVLISDGAPNCGRGPCDPSVPDSPNDCDDANAIAAVEQAYVALGIPTFVVGLAGTGDLTLTDQAVKGGLATATSPYYYKVGSAAELSAAFSAIVALTAR